MRFARGSPSDAVDDFFVYMAMPFWLAELPSAKCGIVVLFCEGDGWSQAQVGEWVDAVMMRPLNARRVLFDATKSTNAEHKLVRKAFSVLDMIA